MTLANCITNKAKSGLVSQIKGKKAADRHREISDALIKAGEVPGVAYQIAADRVLDEVSYAAAVPKRRLLADIETRRGLDMAVTTATPEALRNLPVRMVDDLDFDARSIHRSANGMIGDFLKRHYPDLLGRVKNPVQFKEFMKALFGEPTGDQASRGFADAVNDVNEYFRLELNKRGYAIGKLENWGLPHSHNALRLHEAGFETWAKDIADGIEWTRMIDNTTGKAFTAAPPAAFQRDFLQNVFDNIIYGRNSKTASWGRTNMKAGNPLEKHRVFAFKNSEAWSAYNQKYGSTDPLSTLAQHIGAMSRELAMARRFGRDHNQAIDYLGQLVTKRAREGGVGLTEALAMDGSVALAKRMVNVMSGGVGPNGLWGARSAKFFATTRKVMSSALLDRAIVISAPSDLNSARMAAQAIQMNPANIMSTYVKLLADEVRGGGATMDDLARQGWIADSLASPGVAASRYQQEFPAAAWADVLSNAAMRVQGMNAHTDNLRLAFQHSFAAHFASVKDLPFDQLPGTLRREMETTGKITAEDWDNFRLTGGEFTAGNGATFLSPLYWHKATSLDPETADDLFIKMQSFVEKWTERAVPTGSLISKGFMDPNAYNLAPGSAPYEFIKSAGMFKSFVGAFVVNQVRMVNSTTSHWSGATGRGAKAAYVVELAFTTTMVGALAMQIGEMMMGRDPRPMNETFWWQALLRGGGLGPVGDILSTGATSWGGSFSGYVAGPVAQLGGDVLKLTVGNVAQAYYQLRDGDEVDLDLIPELATFISRYTPMGQTPLAAGGAAYDRMFLDQFQLVLDPDSINDMMDSNTRRKNRNGNDAWWMPGTPLPTRGPGYGGGS